jgi:transposase-like protein
MKDLGRLFGKYFRSGAVVCPFCNSKNIDAGDYDFGVCSFYQNVRCPDCKKEWTDEYTLTSIKLIDNESNSN